MNESQINTMSPSAPRTYRPALTYYHPNGKGTGCAVSFELHPAHEKTAGSIFASFAVQKSVSSGTGPTRTFPAFDWANKICVKLDIQDLAQILLVFRGVQESIGNDGKGLFHRSAKADTVIRLEHKIEPTCSYLLEVSKRPVNMPPETPSQRARLFFTPAEALGLCLSIEGVLSVIAFGIPVVTPRLQQTVPSSAPEPDDESAPF